MRDSDKSNSPRAPRVPVTPKGEVFDGLTWAKVIIQDVSESGVCMVCTRQFDPGQTLGLRLLPKDAGFIDCTIEVRHSNYLGTGAVIVSMDEKYRRAYDKFLREALFEQRSKS